MGEFLNRLQRFLTEDIWRVRVSNLPRAKSWAVQLLRVLLLTFREFDKDKCQLRASAMTFYSLLVIVPVVALIFGIAKGFDYDQQLQREFRNRIRVGMELKEGAIGQLAEQLYQYEDAPPTYPLALKLSAETRKLISDFVENKEPAKSPPAILVEALKMELNDLNLLANPNLFRLMEPELTDLPDELSILWEKHMTQEEGQNDLKDDELIQLNHLLLEAAYPSPVVPLLKAELNDRLNNPELLITEGFPPGELLDALSYMGRQRNELGKEELIRYNSLLFNAAFPDTVVPLTIMDQGRNQVVEKTIEFSNNLLKSSHGGLIAGAGILILLWTVIRMLQTIEHSLNEIWGIRRRRSFRRMLSNYLSLMFVFPILLVLFPALTQYVVTRVDNLATDPRLIDQFVRLTPFLLLWLLLSIAYTLTPNTKVSLLSGLLAGLVAALIFVIVQKLIIALQIGVSKYSPVYGSFLAFPLLLIWLHASWMIMLFGAEFSFAHQNVGTYEFEQDCAGISHAYKTLLALRLSHLSVKRFHQGEPPITAQEAAQTLHIPIRLVRDILFELCEAGVLTELRGDDKKDLAYQPGRDPETLSVKFVKEALDRRGSANIPVYESEELHQLKDCLAQFDKALENSPANVLLKNI